MNIKKYRTWMFDCDGVILDSNKTKTDAFYEVAAPYGIDAAEKLVKHHKQYGGVSRYEKMKVLLRDILKKPLLEEELNRLIERYGNICKSELLTCDETPGMRSFLDAISKHADLFVVSGGRQDELREIFKKRGLDKYFKGICGSPVKKLDIVQNLKENKIDAPAVFIGDARLDYLAACSINADFIFMSEFSEFSDWQEYFADKENCRVIKNLTELQEFTEHIPA